MTPTVESAHYGVGNSTGVDEGRESAEVLAINMPRHVP